MAHDFKNYLELSDEQLEELQFQSPHKQITEDFRAKVVKVHDGDTITLRTDFRDFDFPLRFLDIDAPELNEGGQAAQEYLEGQILGEEVEIRINKRNRVDKYGRLLGWVFHMGMNMGDVMERMGLVWPFGRRREGMIPTPRELFKRYTV